MINRRVRLLTPSYLAELATAVRQKPETFAHLALSNLLRWRYHIALQSYYGAEIFVSSARRRAERRVLYTAKAYLDDIAAWLRRGGSIFNGPEGRLTPDGRLSPITGGMYRVLRASPPDTSVLPIALVYDFMTTGRPRLFVDVTAPIENAPTCSRQELFATLRPSWLLAARFTCTQLASGVITAYGRLPDPVFSTPRLVDVVCAQAHKLAGEGRHVDKRLLDARGAAHLWRGISVRPAPRYCATRRPRSMASAADAAARGPARWSWVSNVAARLCGERVVRDVVRLIGSRRLHGPPAQERRTPAIVSLDAADI